MRLITASGIDGTCSSNSVRLLVFWHWIVLVASTANLNVKIVLVHTTQAYIMNKLI